MRIALVGAEIEENLALRYIAASLEAAGHEVAVLDFHDRRQVPELAAEIARGGFGLVGLSMIFTARSREFLELAERARELGFAGHATAGGHFAALHAARLVEDCEALDSVVHGEGEEPMVELAASPGRPDRVAGLTYRDRDGRPRSTGPRPNVDDLDRRPWPRRPARLHRYLGLPIANLLSSRGCYASCAFCSIHAYHRLSGGKRFRQRRVEPVADEMAALYHDRGVRIFNFQDDNFFVPSAARNLERYAALRDALEERGVGRVAIQAKGRPDCIDERVVALLREMGLFRLFLGVETDANEGLITLGRGMDREDNHRALDILRRHDIHTCFNLLMFDPGSTLETIRTNVDFMGRQGWFPLNFCRVEVYGGTPIEASLAAEGRLLGDYLGRSYRIADPRAQRAYELFRAVFWPRNFDFAGAHFGSMKLDYNLHLLGHFFPERRSPALVETCKGLLAELNRHSAELMGRILDFCGSNAFDDRAATDALRRELEEERERFDEPLVRRMNALVAHMEALAALEPGRRRFLEAAMGTAAAAALVTTAPACGPRHTHMCEAPPPPPYDTHMCEAPPPPEPPIALSGPALQEARDAVQARVDQVVWPRAHESFPAGAAFVLRVVATDYGVVSDCQVVSGEAAPGLAQAICAGLQEAPLELQSVQVPPGSVGWQADLPLSWMPSGQGPGGGQGEVTGPLDDTHMCEAPPPPDHEITIDRTHMCEAPPPPDHELLRPPRRR